MGVDAGSNVYHENLCMPSRHTCDVRGLHGAKPGHGLLLWYFRRITCVLGLCSGWRRGGRRESRLPCHLHGSINIHCNSPLRRADKHSRFTAPLPSSATLFNDFRKAPVLLLNMRAFWRFGIVRREGSHAQPQASHLHVAVEAQDTQLAQRLGRRHRSEDTLHEATGVVSPAKHRARSSRETRGALPHRNTWQN